jgi:CRP-like cAMP-binding protein
METIDFLKRTSLFGGCSESELQRLIASGRQRVFKADDRIIRDGHPGGQGFYLIISGAAEVRKGEKLRAELGPGDYFGEMALLLEDTPRTADVVAIADTKCLIITQWEFRSLLNTHPDMAAKIMTELAQRLSNTDRALTD